MELDLMKFIGEQALVLVPVLWVIGSILKGIPNIPDWLIPIALLILGIAGGLFVVGFNVAGVLQGILVAGAAVGLHQTVKQAKKQY